jgi:hypothetical protein
MMAGPRRSFAMRALLLIPLILAATACAGGPQTEAQIKYEAKEGARLDVALAGKTAGKPLSCLPRYGSHGVESYGDSTLLFRVSRKLVYRNDVRGTCKGVGRDRALITRSFSGALCRGDIAQSADLVAGFSTGHCVLGDFIPYKG